MRKNTKFLAVLSSAAMMSAVTPGLASAIPSFVSTAFAASAGWVDEDGSLRYKDSDGYYLTDSWKKRDNEWYYLNEDGYISRSEKIDEYYVDEEGKRVLNTWIVEENEDSWGDDEPENFWYYYGKDGKNVTSKWQTIEGKEYYFNEDGYMETGKITLDGYTYYLGEEGDGAMKKGWIQLENEDENAEESMVWHFFDNRGRMIMNEVDRKISGAYYTFENGIMQTGWYRLPEAASEITASASDATPSGNASAPEIASYQYYAADGKRASGWYTIEGVDGIHEDGEEFTFYFKDGKPYHAQTGIQIAMIDSKRYGFNTLGERQTGLQTITLEDGISTASCYFGDDGVVRTGKQTIFNEELGENQTWYFLTDGGNKGHGFHGIRDNSVYDQGLRLEADRDLRYAPVTLDGTRYLVNTSGVIQKASASSRSSVNPDLGTGFKDVKDSNDKIWIVDVNGMIQE
jgi:glucan-binding YG repeat protein